MFSGMAIATAKHDNQLTILNTRNLGTGHYCEMDLVSGSGGQSSNTAAGVRVNPVSTLALAAALRAVTLISTDVAKTPVFVYRRVEGGRERDNNHAAQWLLHDQANEQMTALECTRQLMVYCLLYGNGYAVIDRDPQTFEPIAIIPVPNGWIWPVRENGQLSYVLSTPETQTTRLQPFDVLHMRGPGFEPGLEGWSPIARAREALGVGLAQQEYSSRFFSGSARSTVVLEMPGRLQDDVAERVAEQWAGMTGGLTNAHKTAILEDGMQAKVISMSAKDSQLLEGREFSVKDVANIFGTPPHKLGDDTRTSYSSLEQEEQSYLNDTLDGWFATLEAEYRAKLLSETQRRARTHTIEFLRQALVRADLAARMDAYNQALAGAAWMTVDEVRARENLNPLPDGAGATIQQPTNNFGEQPTASTQDDENARQWLEADIARAAARLAKVAERASRKPREFIQSIQGLDDHRPTVITILEPGSRTFGLDPKTVADALISEARASYTMAAEVPPSALEASVAVASRSFVATIPIKVMR